MFIVWRLDWDETAECAAVDEMEDSGDEDTDEGEADGVGEYADEESCV